MIDAITSDEIEKLDDEGDGHAVFFGEGTHDEFLEFEKEQKGLKKLYRKIGL